MTFSNQTQAPWTTLTLQTSSQIQVVFCFYLSHPTGVSNFTAKANHAISQFESLLNQIQQNEKDIDAKLQAMESANLFKFTIPERAGELPGNGLPIFSFTFNLHQIWFRNDWNVFVGEGVKEFCELMEKQRAKDVHLLTRKYSAIQPLLTKIECLTMQTSSSKAKPMAQYYAYWERRVFDSLTKMVLKWVCYS